jgi:hypothetical protein
MVTLEATFVVPREIIGGDFGEIVLLDRDLEVLAGPVSFSGLANVPGASTSGTVAGHIVRRFSWTDPDLAASGEKPRSARWLLIRPPAPFELPPIGNFNNYLTQVCGITLADWQSFQEHEQNVALTISQLQTLSGLWLASPASPPSPCSCRVPPTSSTAT